MEMNEAEIYEGLGLEVPAEGGGEPEDIPPAEQQVEETVPEDTPDPEEGDGEEVPEGGDKAPAPPHERDEAALAREQAVQAEQARKQQEAEDRAYAAAYAGRINPYTRRPITTKAEHEEYQRQFQEEQRKEQLQQMRDAGIDPDLINNLIGSHPAVQQAQAVIAQAEAERVKAQEAQAKVWYQDQLKEISALDPAVKSLEDLATGDAARYGRMLDMVSRGLSMVEAYKAVNFDVLAQKRTAAAQQAARNQAAGKAHLAPTGGQGKAAVEVPSSMREMYRELNPGMTEEQITQAYTKYLKETGG